MRAHLNIASLLAQLTRQAPTAIPESLELNVALHGAPASAWLMWRHRAQIHKHGAVDFKMPADAETPPWFRIAWEFLKRRKDWACTLQKTRFTRTYRVRWLGWGTYSRETTG